MRGMQSVWAVFVFVAFVGLAHAQAQAQSPRGENQSVRASRSAPTGGIGLTLGGGFSFDPEPNTFRMGPRGWLWLHSAEKLRLGLVLPLSIVVGSRNRGRFDREGITLYEIAPSGRAALQVSDLVRPYFDFGMGMAIVTLRDRDRFGREDSETRGSFLLRTALGADVLLKQVPGLVVNLELIAVHARLAGFSGGDAVILVGAGYEF